MVSVSLSRKSLVATTALTCCIGLEIRRRTLSSILQMPVTDFFLSSFFTNEKAVSFVQTRIRTAKAKRRFIPVVQVVEVLDMRGSVSLQLHVRHQRQNLSASLVTQSRSVLHNARLAIIRADSAHEWQSQPPKRSTTSIRSGGWTTT